jgi:hypothetical protein
VIRRSFLVIGAIMALVIGLGSGAAYAFFTSHGSGSGAVSTGTPLAVTVQAVASGTVSSFLIPGGNADLLVQISNPNGYSVIITGISQNLSGSVTGSGGIGTCTTTGVTVPTQTGLSITVGSGTNVLHVANGASMSTVSDSGCQGATIHIPVIVTVHR